MAFRMPEASQIHGSALRQFRASEGLLAKDLAEAADVSASYISEIENGKRSLTRSLADRIAPHLALTPESFWGQLKGLMEGPPNSSKLHEASMPYRARPSNRWDHMSDSQILATYFLRSLTREEAFALLAKFTRAAAEGDHSGYPMARALLELLPLTHPQPP